MSLNHRIRKVLYFWKTKTKQKHKQTTSPRVSVRQKYHLHHGENADGKACHALGISTLRPEKNENTCREYEGLSQRSNKLSKKSLDTR